MQKKLNQIHSKLKGTISTIEAGRNLRENPGKITAASKEALNRLQELLTYFEQNWLDANGNIIKISWWKWIFNGKLRAKVSATFDEVMDAINDIVELYRA